MPDIIHLLPDSVANQIAAGEVIQRPASVVKELVENAVDAGATEVSLLVKDAGRTLIQVIDNGKGMSMTDARFAFERHATSKIKRADDLFALTTMGFRGEALASIAAVAQVELKTRQAGSDVATRILMAASVVEEQEQVAAPIGSSFAIKNLFYNIPARRKFLKSNATEWNNIMTEFERLALVNPEVAFKCFHNDIQMHSLPAQNMKQRIVGLFGKNLASMLLPVEVTTSLVQIGGFVGMPSSSKKRGAHQYFFVNGRYMRHPYFQKAVSYCYEQLIPGGEQPHFFLYLKIDPSTIDVNIHPTKTEIKFENEQPIWQIIAASVKEALGRFNGVPSIDFDQDDAPGIPVAVEGSIPPPRVSIDPSYNPFKTTTSYSSTSGRSVPVNSGWQQVYDDFRTEKMRPAVDSLDDNDDLLAVVGDASNVSIFEDKETGYKADKLFTVDDVLLFNPRYIAVKSGDGLIVVHKQRAHARVLYERFYYNIVQRTNESQRLVFPEVIEFSPAEVAVIDEIQEELFAAGFDVSDLGGGSYSLLGVPAGLDVQDTAAILHKVLYMVIETGLNVRENVAQSLAVTLSNNMAYVDAKRITPIEAASLLNQLFALSTPAMTADGRIVVHAMTPDFINKQFNG